MRILALQCIGVEGVRDGEYNFADASGKPADVVVVSGTAGSGKTRLLELLLLVRNVLAPTNEEVDEEAWVRLGGRSARVGVTFWLDPHEQHVVGYASPAVATETILSPDPELVAEVEPDAGLCFLLDRYDHSAETAKLEYFGENRRLDIGGGTTSLEPESQKKLRTSKDARKFSFVPALLASLRRDPAGAETLSRHLAAFSASCSFDPTSGAFSSGGRTLRGLEELSASERDALVFSAVTTLVGFSHSVLFIDRPDLYMRDEARLLAALTGLGASNQLFVTSYGGDLFKAAESRRVIALG
jgi:hypothetical protein